MRRVLTPEERRLRAAAKQARMRLKKAKAGTCRRCPEPVAIGERTGRPARMCRKHLDEDGSRKDGERDLGGRQLRWLDDPRIAYGQRAPRHYPIEVELPWFNDPAMEGIAPAFAPWPPDWEFELLDEADLG